MSATHTDTKALRDEYVSLCEQLGQLARMRYGLTQAVSGDDAYKGAPPEDLVSQIRPILEEVEKRLSCIKALRDKRWMEIEAIRWLNLMTDQKEQDHE